MNILLSHCQQIEKLTDDKGNTLLHKAAILGNSQFFKIIMDAGIDLASENKDRETPMDLAAIEGQIGIIEDFIYCYEGSKHKRLLDFAQSAGKRYIVQFLLSTVFHFVDDFGNTPMHNAVQKGSLQMVKVLLGRCLAPNAQNHFGVSPLHIAVREIANIIKSTRKETVSNNDQTKKVDELVEIVKFISISCDNLDCQDFDGNTALHIAAREGLIEIVEILMPLYKNLSIKNKKENTPVELAYGRDDTIGDLLMDEIVKRS